MDEFVESVLSRLTVPDPIDVPAVRRAAAELFREGWTVSEAVRLLRNMEEVDPGLAEDLALRRMSKIRTEVEIRKSSSR